MRTWYYEYNLSAEGPVREEDILRMIDDGMIKAETGLWREGMVDWQPAASVRPFSDEFGQPPPLPGNQSYRADPPRRFLSVTDSYDSPHGGGRTHSEEHHVPNYMGRALLATFCCFLPIGILAIVKAVGVSSALRRGDYGEARDLSYRAKMWSDVGIGVGLFIGVIYVIINFLD